jgi:hypothetical protein
MAPDDDYRRDEYRRDEYRREDNRRWDNAEDDRRWREERERERSRKLHDAMLRGDHDAARWILGVPPADPAYDIPDEPESTGPPTVGDQFREHKQGLLFNLEWAYNFLPQEQLADWAARVGPLDIEQAEAGLAAIEAIRDEYQQAASYYEPPYTQVSRRIDWNYYVPRIGHEIEWLIAIFRHVLSSR